MDTTGRKDPAERTLRDHSKSFSFRPGDRSRRTAAAAHEEEDKKEEDDDDDGRYEDEDEDEHKRKDIPWRQLRAQQQHLRSHASGSRSSDHGDGSGQMDRQSTDISGNGIGSYYDNDTAGNDDYGRRNNPTASATTLRDADRNIRQPWSLKLRSRRGGAHAAVAEKGAGFQSRERW